MVDASKYDGSEATISIEGRFVQLYFNAIEKLPECWMNDHGLNKAKYNQQIQFLISLLPFEEEQDKIFKAWHDRKTELKALMPDMREDELIFSANLVPVTKIMNFICSNFELINTDIVGPATARQYRDSAIQMPDDMKNPYEKIVELP
jgi:hypothetical protein